MSPCLEFEGKSVEKAVSKASEKLGVPTGKIKYDVISYGSTGIFGLVGIRKAKIRVTYPEAPVETTSRKRRNGYNKRRDDEVSALVQEAFDDGKVETFSTEPLQLGKNILQRIIDFITTDATITVTEEDDRIFYHVKGGNSAVLIGKRGQTLEAIQYLVEKIVNKHHKERIRLQIDIEGYLENRRTRLRSLAQRLAEKAKQTGKPSTISQLNSHDRRIVHLSLKDDSNVRTQSMGDGFYRKLVIFPKRKRTPKQKDSD